MEIFAEKEKLELDRGIFLTEEVVKDIHHTERWELGVQ
jgi:hypothetical protein